MKPTRAATLRTISRVRFISSHLMNLGKRPYSSLSATKGADGGYKHGIVSVSAWSLVLATLSISFTANIFRSSTRIGASPFQRERPEHIHQASVRDADKRQTVQISGSSELKPSNCNPGLPSGRSRQIEQDDKPNKTWANPNQIDSKPLHRTTGRRTNHTRTK